jgi:hypothetical protein
VLDEDRAIIAALNSERGAKVTKSVRYSLDMIKAVEEIAPEGNFSLFVRMLIQKELNRVNQRR